MEPKPEKLERFVGLCPGCGEESQFIYKGIRKGSGAVPHFEMYTCPNCSSTFDKKSIIQKWMR